MKIRDIVSLGLFPLCFVWLWTVEKNIYPLLLLFQICIHELGHITVALFCRAKFRKIRVRYFGLSITYDTTSISYISETLILLSGAAANFFCSALSLMIFSHTPEAVFFSSAGFALGIFNLIPFKKSDGGRALSSILKSFCCEVTSHRIVSAVHLISAFFLWGIAVAAQFVYKINLSLLILSVYILLEFIIYE